MGTQARVADPNSADLTQSGDLTPAVDSLEAAFRRITQVVKRSARDFAVSVHPELRPAGWIVLSTVFRGSPQGRAITVGEIIAETGMDKSVVSRQLRSLADWGLVAMSRAEEDARVVVVEATEATRERMRAVRERQRERYANILGAWPETDLRRLGELLDRLADAVAGTQDAREAAPSHED